MKVRALVSLAAAASSSTASAFFWPFRFGGPFFDAQDERVPNDGGCQNKELGESRVRSEIDLPRHLAAPSFLDSHQRPIVPVRANRAYYPSPAEDVWSTDVISVIVSESDGSRDAEIYIKAGNLPVPRSHSDGHLRVEEPSTLESECTIVCVHVGQGSVHAFPLELRVHALAGTKFMISIASDRLDPTKNIFVPCNHELRGHHQKRRIRKSIVFSLARARRVIDSCSPAVPLLWGERGLKKKSEFSQRVR